MKNESQPESDSIVLKGVRTHNLKNLNVSFPLEKLTVVTGLSGSGKSSLVFDTLYAESYRRYLESLSGYARQFMQQLPRPDLDEAENLPPAVAVRQSRQGAGHRSTVGTLSGVNDLVKGLFARLGRVWCPGCQKPVLPVTDSQAGDLILKEYFGEKVLLLSPLRRWKQADPELLKEQLVVQGFTKTRNTEGDISELAGLKAVDLLAADLVIDRVILAKGCEERLRDSLRSGFQAGKGVLRVVAGSGEEHVFVKNLCCFTCDLDFREAVPALFSFSHPLGACPSCKGSGSEAEPDWSAIIPDMSLSLQSRGVKALNFGQHGVPFYSELIRQAEKLGTDREKAFSDYTGQEMLWLKSGIPEGSGVIAAFFSWLDSKKFKPHFRIHRARFTRYRQCRLCQGHRFSKDSLAFRLYGYSPPQVFGMSVDRMHAWLYDQQAFPLHESREDEDLFLLCEEMRRELIQILTYLIRTGLGYLTLNRSHSTLSGGELQRIHLARCLGSSLTQTLFCLDEPTAGLHARDKERLLSLMKELCQQGNTVVVVEHDGLVINGADHRLNLGPSAGSAGGEICPDLRQEDSEAKVSEESRPASFFLQLKHISTHNLKNVSVNIPLQRMTSVCGLSGSGKSSLISKSLFPLLKSRLNGCPLVDPGLNQEQMELTPGAEAFLREVYQVDQSSLARSSRSNLMTFLGLYDHVRKLLSDQDLARHLGLNKGSFSFNVPGGRCEECKGLGMVVEDLSFLGEMDVICPVCEGRRFAPEVLRVCYRGKNLTAMMGMTAEEARSFFYDHGALGGILAEVCRIGLGYMTLGQPTGTLSGGEAQRLRLLGVLKEISKKGPACFIFDEPGAGLSDRDVYNLIKYFKDLVRDGHTVVVVAHHLDILRHSDYLIELGPGAGEMGGELIFQGPPGEIINCLQSVTSPYLVLAGKTGQGTGKTENPSYV